MSREIYTPIFDGFFEGSIMLEEIPTRWLLLVMIRLGLRPRANGIIDLPVQRLAALAAMSEDGVRKALAALLRPDPLSGSKAEEGRRIVQLNAEQPGRGWRLVNFETYREMAHRVNDAARKKAEREAREAAAAGKPKPPEPKTPKSLGNPKGKSGHSGTRSDTAGSFAPRPETAEMALRDDTRRSDPKREEKEGERGAPRPTRSGFSSPSVEEVRAEITAKGYTFNPERFIAVNESKGWKGILDWRAAAKAWQTIEKDPSSNGNGHDPDPRHPIVKSFADISYTGKPEEPRHPVMKSLADVPYDGKPTEPPRT
jgi:hypothetical protein